MAGVGDDMEHVVGSNVLNIEGVEAIALGETGQSELCSCFGCQEISPGLVARGDQICMEMHN